VPYQITSGIRFFEQAHVRDFVAQLRFVANPNDVMAFYRFSSLLPKIGGKTAERILQTAQAHAEAQAVSLYAALGTEGVLAKVPDVARESWTSLCDTLLEMAQAAKRQEAPEAIIQIGIQGWYGDFLRTLYPNWTSRRDDLDSLVQFAGKHNDLADLLTQLTLLSSETHGRGAESSVDSLRLSTVHQAKGLEFRVVFVLGLSENLFPIKRAVEEGNIDEELRLFYVAVTRAQDELYLIHPRVTYQGNFPTLLKPSRFVADLPQHLYELVQLPSAKDAAARATRSASFGRS
jgi:DNA helicase-2/ATP-dependent DNA helicase PcrA